MPAEIWRAWIASGSPTLSSLLTSPSVPPQERPAIKNQANTILVIFFMISPSFDFVPAMPANN
jgi:hypothetical protein